MSFLVVRFVNSRLTFDLPFPPRVVDVAENLGSGRNRTIQIAHVFEESPSVQRGVPIWDYSQ
jgi:hypothetical protein